MTHITPEARARAGETRKRRTREKLIQAADRVLRDDGWNATVEVICEDAGVSVPTFYNFYHSRNELCMDAFIELVVVPLENLGLSDRPFAESLAAFVKQCEGRSVLVRATLAHRLEGSFDYRSELSKDDFIVRIATLLADRTPPKVGPRYAAEGYLGAYFLKTRMIALYVLDSIATRIKIDPHELRLIMSLTVPKD